MSRRSADRTVAAKKEQRDRNNSSNDNDVDPRMFFPSCRRRHTVGHFGSLNSLRRDFKYPCEYECDRQTDDNQQDNQTNRPVRNIKNRKNLRKSLRKRPARHNVRDRDFVNIAPLELGEEIAWIHAWLVMNG